MSELLPDADRGALMHGEYAGACDACHDTDVETKVFGGIILCPICRAGNGRQRVINAILECRICYPIFSYGRGLGEVKKRHEIYAVACKLYHILHLTTEQREREI